MKLRKKSIKINNWALLLLIFVLMWVSFGAGIYLSGKSEIIKKISTKEAEAVGRVMGKYTKDESGTLGTDINFNLFWETWNTISEKYVDKNKISEKEMFYGALKGMVNSVGDPYTVFMPPSISKEFDDSMEGKFEGIGAEIGIRDEVLTVITPLSGMPAEAAGLKAGDKIHFVDKKPTSGLSTTESVKMIRGEKGTDVTLSITREDLSELKDITITRDTIIVKSITTTMRDDNIFVIKISNFNTDTEDLFNQAVREILKNNPKGIIIDLRNNPGGYLDTAIEISSEWVENGIIVSEKFGEDNIKEHLARGQAKLAGIKTVILVNLGSASASEIVAGALQDYGLATIVGTQTFGKGSVQSLSKLGDGSSIKITVAKWLTPKGRSINDDGITPDIEIDYTIEDFENDNDVQMNKAVEIILDKQIIANE